MASTITPASQLQQGGGPPTHRGRLLTAAQVADLLFSGTVSSAWVRRNVPHKLILGHSTVRWYEFDVQRWIANQHTCAPVAAGVL